MRPMGLLDRFRRGSASPPAPARARRAVDPSGLAERLRHQAVVFHQHVPPRADALSAWGGLPRLGPLEPWPEFVTTQGTPRALTHVLQIACADVPPQGLVGFPDHGALHLFLDLTWGDYWQWRWTWTPEDPAGLPEARPPACLPPAFESRGLWRGALDDRDWPRVLPRWSVTPRLLVGDATVPRESADDDPRMWPGTIDLVAQVQAIDGGVVDTTTDWYGDVARPYPGFPSDWRGVRLCLGHLRRCLDQTRRRPTPGSPSSEEFDDIATKMAPLATASLAHLPDEPTDQATADAVWALLSRPDRLLQRQARSEAVRDAIEATAAHHPDPERVLPSHALDLVRGRHALATTYQGRPISFVAGERFLGPPTCVQEAAWNRLGDGWVLFFEMGSNDPIAHFFAEGVYQFWIRPEDLAVGRLDRIELDAEAY